MSHTLEPGLRKLGVPTRLVKGKVVLEMEADDEAGYVVCREGDRLDSRQTALLKMFGVRTSEFSVGVRGYWRKDDGGVTDVNGEGGGVGGGGRAEEGMEIDGDEEGEDEDEE